MAGELDVSIPRNKRAIIISIYVYYVQLKKPSHLLLTTDMLLQRNNARKKSQLRTEWRRQWCTRNVVTSSGCSSRMHEPVVSWWRQHWLGACAPSHLSSSFPLSLFSTCDWPYSLKHATVSAIVPPDLWIPVKLMSACNPADTRRWTNVDLMLAQSRRRWANIKLTLVQCLLLTGKVRELSVMVDGGPRLCDHW